MASDALSRGFAFEFSNLVYSDLRVKTESTGLIPLAELELNDNSNACNVDFEIPLLRLDDAPSTEDLKSVDSDPLSFSISSKSECAAAETETDFWPWNLDLTTSDDEPKLCTWEAFERRQFPTIEGNGYLSEAGPAVFDAALNQLRGEASAEGILQQDVALRALCNLILGRSSLFFSWDPIKRSFEHVLLKVSISGYSLNCHRSFVADMIDCGSKFRSLSEYANTETPSSQPCTAIVTFSSCISDVLAAMEQQMAARSSNLRSVLQLQYLIEKPRQLLAALEKLVQSIHGLQTDEAVISALSDRVHALVSVDTIFAKTLQEVLARTSGPWLRRLCNELGLPHDHGTQGAEYHESMQDGLSQDSGVSYMDESLDPEALSAFVCQQDQALVQATRTSLKMLRQYLPSWEVSSTRNARSLSISNYIKNVPSMTTPSQFQGDRSGGTLSTWTSSDESLAWVTDSEQRTYLEALDSRISHIPVALASCPLMSLTCSAISSDEQIVTVAASIDLAEAIHVDPLEQIRPALRTHLDNINRQLLSHFFGACRLRYHLDILRQFHLLGNGEFLWRLKTSLFSADVQSAERRRGRIPTSETMGLRLGALDGQKWPPASSELQLTLMGVLTETHDPFSHTRSQQSAGKDLPGGLSFSVREMPETEIEKVMDAESIYALDFLRLQYSPPPPLDAIITGASIQAYDEVFRFLLKLVRVLHVTTSLRQSVTSNRSATSQRTSDRAQLSTSFAVEAHHCVSILMSHFTDIGISAKWHDLLSSLASIEDALAQPDVASSSGDIVPTLPGIEDIRRLHETCIEGMRTRLFLRRKQQKLKTAVGEVLVSILTCASFVQRTGGMGSEMQESITLFRNARSQLVALLQNAVEKPLNTVEAYERTREEVEMMRLLLGRLS